MDAVDALAVAMGSRLMAGAIQGGLLVVAGWLLCRCVPRIAPSLQAWVWWLACLRLLAGLLPIPAMPLPVLPPPAAAVRVAPPVTISESIPARAIAPAPAAAIPAASPAPVSWITLLMALWALAVVLHAARLLVEYVRVRRVVRDSTPASDASRHLAASVAARLGMASVPEIRSSTCVTAPQTLGAKRPIVVLPADADAALPESERAMVLAHELMHVRRRDVALGWVPAIAERLFFFHPLARVAAREYLIAREAACDAGAIEALGIAPARYGEMLVAIGLHRRTSFAAASGAWSSSSLKRRLEMLQYARRRRVSPVARWSFAIAASVCLMPFQLVARPAAQEGPRGVQARGQNVVGGLQEREVVAAGRDPRPVVAAGLQARPNAQDTAAAREVERRRAETVAMLETLTRRLEGLPDGHPDRARGEAELEGMRRALSELQSDDVRRTFRETVAAAEQLSEAYRREIEQALETLQSETGSRAVAEKMAEAARLEEEIARAARSAQIEALGRMLPAQAAAADAQTEGFLRMQAEQLRKALQTLEQQLDQLRRQQEQLREDQRTLQQALERLTK